MADARPWTYGTDDDLAPHPTPGHLYVEHTGGPIDRQLLDVTGYTAEERAEGALLISDRGCSSPTAAPTTIPAPEAHPV